MNAYAEGFMTLVIDQGTILSPQACLSASLLASSSICPGYLLCLYVNTVYGYSRHGWETLQHIYKRMT